MCGIAGFFSKSSSVDEGWLPVASQSLAHRGPDAAGIWVSPDRQCGLAHRRLSIVDLSEDANQPMVVHNNYLIVFNGEIYNFLELREELLALGHSFPTTSDTEVLLKAFIEWGDACLSKLQGMFAFAIYDVQAGRLFLARDRAGEKPLFYRYDGDSLYFASELKALMTHPSLPRTIDREAMDCYLALGYVPGDRCILQGFAKLPPAHALSVDLHAQSLKVWSYWQLPQAPSEEQPTDIEELVVELESLLLDSVRRQLIADVPVGVLLSGGVDSSLITALASKCASKVRTFTIAFPGHGSLDESAHARLIANHFGTDHVELVGDPTTAEVFPELVKQFDEPMADSSMFPTWLVSRLVREHCTVALGGDGGDELFGGYNSYSRLLWMQRRMGRIPGPLRSLAAAIGGRALPVGFKGRNYLLSLAMDFSAGIPTVNSLLDVHARAQLLGSKPHYEPVAEEIARQRTPGQRDLLQRVTRYDFNNYLADDILVKVDRASMMHSLELRAPLLDAKLIEFAFGRVPSKLKATDSDKKILLKKLCARILPPEFDFQRKQGFSIPLSEWLKSGPFRELFWDTLNAPDCSFDKKAVQRLQSGQDKGRSNAERLFALVQFELWRKHYNVSF